MRKLTFSSLLVIVSLCLFALLLLVAPLTLAQDVQPTATPLFGDTFGLPTPTLGDTPIPISLTGVNGRADRGPVAIRSGPGSAAREDARGAGDVPSRQEPSTRRAGC